jgi:hypothetical protein
MKKIVALLFLCLFVSLMNASTMPVDLSGESASAMVVGHDHCQEAASATHAESSKPSASSSAAHYCCAVVAVLMAPPVFSVSKQVDVHLLADVARPSSNIAESIYKPPRNYL